MFIIFIIAIKSQLEMFFAIDVSNDVSRRTLERLKEFVAAQGQIFNLSSEKTRLSLFSYGETATKLLPLDQGISALPLRLALDKVSGRMGQRKVVSVLRAVKDVVANNKDGLREKAKMILVIFIAGRDVLSSLKDLNRESEALRKLGVSLAVVGVGPFIGNDEIKTMQIRADNLLFSETDDSLFSAISNISRQIGSIQRKRDKIDVAFVIGARRPNDYQQFELGKKLIANVVRKLDVAQEAIRIGLVVYGSDARIALQLDRSINREDIFKSLNELQMPEAGNGLAKALDLSRTYLMSEERGVRKGVPKAVVVLLTSEVDQLSRVVSTRLIEDGLVVKGIALSSSVSLDSVKSISSTPMDAIRIVTEREIADVAKRISGSLLPGRLNTVCYVFILFF